MKKTSSEFLIYVDTIMYLLLYNLHDCTFNYKSIIHSNLNFTVQ